MYQIQILDSAIEDLSHLDKAISRRIVHRIRWLADNLDAIKPLSLSGDPKGLFKLRVGDYRVIYEIIHTDKILIIHLIGHRSEIYRQR